MTVSPTRIVSSTFWLSSGQGPDQHQEPQHCDVDSSDPVQCLKLLRELNGQVTSYHQLATSLGTSGDGQPLRGRLKRTRRRARQLASIVRRNILILSLDGNGDSSDGRLWCLLYCCLYVLALEMQRTLQLQRTFALHPAAGFINTGLVMAHQQAKKQQQQQQLQTNSLVLDDDDDIPLADRLSLERAEINQLQQEIEELEYALQELRSNHNVVEIESYWTCGSVNGEELHLMAGDVERSIVNQQTTTTCYYGGGGGARSCAVTRLSVGEICNHRMGGVMASVAAVDEGEEDDDSLMGRSVSSLPPFSSSSSDDGDQDSNSLVKQRRCLCVVMGVVIVVFVLATVLGASLAFQQ